MVRFGNVYTLWIYGEPIVVVQKFEHVVEIHERSHEHSLQKVHDLALSGGILTGVSTDRKWKYIRKVRILLDKKTSGKLGAYSRSAADSPIPSLKKLR